MSMRQPAGQVQVTDLAWDSGPLPVAVSPWGCAAVTGRPDVVAHIAPLLQQGAEMTRLHEAVMEACGPEIHAGQLGALLVLCAPEATHILLAGNLHVSVTGNQGVAALRPLPGHAWTHWHVDGCRCLTVGDHRHEVDATQTLAAAGGIAALRGTREASASLSAVAPGPASGQGVTTAASGVGQQSAGQLVSARILTCLFAPSASASRTAAGHGGRSHAVSPAAGAGPAAAHESRSQATTDPGRTLSQTALLETTGDVVSSEQNIVAVLCAAGHPNPPHASSCHLCDAPLGGMTTRICQPLVAVLRHPDGTRIDLTADVIIGRRPRAPQAGPGERPCYLLTVGDGSATISKNHCALRVDGWDMSVEDLGSTNGTVVWRPGQSPMRLMERHPVFVTPGDVIDVGDGIRLTIEAPQ